ncbi:MAG: thioredoxin family protein [Planctomycetota bacterium]
MIDRSVFESVFLRAKPYAAYLAADPARADGWRAVYDRTALSEVQRAEVAGFVRTMKVLVVSGAWCGDCVQQGPLIARIAEANPRIDLRWVDRDAEAEFSARVRICGGGRVPVAIFAAEDGEVCSVLGDRTLSRYRGLARRQLGAACELPWAEIPADEGRAVLQEWLDEFERVQWMLRLSPRLRQKHGD